jgi:hypothetical protein
MVARSVMLEGAAAGRDLGLGEAARVSLLSVRGEVEGEGSGGVRELMSSPSAFHCEVLENGRVHRNVRLGDVAESKMALKGD